jgi:hypothetical protein
MIDIEPWALELPADMFRVTFYSQLTGREPPRRFVVSDAELAGAEAQLLRSESFEPGGP